MPMMKKVFNTNLVLPLAVGLFILVLWEILVFVFHIPFYILPAPSQILKLMIDNYSVLINNAVYTVQEVIWGYLLGVTLGIIAGVFSTYLSVLKKGFFPLAVASNCVPIIAYAPFAILWFGFGQASKVFLCAMVIFFPIYLSTITGLTSVSEDKLNLMKSWGATKFDIFINLRYPLALSTIFTSLKIIVPISFFAALAGEFWASYKGIGFLIMAHATLLDTVYVWAAIVTTSIAGISLYFLVSITEKIFIPWHTSFRKT